MDSDLQELLRDARKELRKADGLPLTAEEQAEDQHKAAVDELLGFILRRMSVVVPNKLCMQVQWSTKGPAAIFKAEKQVFHLRKAEGDGSCLLFIIEGEAEREIARIVDSDPQFCNRVVASIGDAVEPEKIEVDRG